MSGREFFMAIGLMIVVFFGTLLTIKQLHPEPIRTPEQNLSERIDSLRSEIKQLEESYVCYPKGNLDLTP